MFKNNHEYRQYLINNAKEIMYLNSENQENQTCLSKDSIKFNTVTKFNNFSDLRNHELNRINKLKY